jgi:diacylglycerol kinase (ATP)
MRACVIFNPMARGEKARRMRAHLDAIGRQATLNYTRGPGDGVRLAAAAVLAGFDTIVAAGGDGTLNEVLNGLASTPGGLKVARLGLLPLGTVNVFARELGLPSQPKDAWQVVLNGREMLVDLPRAEWNSAAGPQSRCFCQLGGAGLDARAIGLVNWQCKKRIGALAYVLAGLQAMRSPRPLIHVRANEQSSQGELVLLGNGRLYGGDFALFPRADLTDGRLEVCVFPRTTLVTLFHIGPSLLLRSRVPERAVRRLSGSAITLSCNQRASFELDGELSGELPATFTVQPAALRVLVP